MKRDVKAKVVKQVAALQVELAEEAKRAQRWEARAVFLEQRAQEAAERRRGRGRAR